MKGYQCTVFDSLPFAGGTMLIGVPAFRLPREAIENVVLLAWASLWGPGLWGRTLRWVRSQPSRTQR